MDRTQRRHDDPAADGLIVAASPGYGSTARKPAMPAKRMTGAEKRLSRLQIQKLLKARYKSRLRHVPRSILETMLYAICLEDASEAQAEKTFVRLTSFERSDCEFFDFNELRVSAISELEPVFAGLDQPEWRGLRVRYVLSSVFEQSYGFKFEGMLPKTVDAAAKRLHRMTHLSPFIRSYTLHAALGGHVVPLDNRMCRAAIWLGLLPAGTTPEVGAEELKPVVLKKDVAAFCHRLRCLATDARVRLVYDFGAKPPAATTFDLRTACERLGELFRAADRKDPDKRRRRKAKPKSARPAPPKKTPSRRTARTK